MSEKMIERVAKLLSLASNNPNEHEAAAAAVKAQAMMLGHSITMIDVARFTGDQRSTITATHAVYTCDTGTRQRGRRAKPTWRAWLAQAVADSMGGKAVICWSKGVKSHGTWTSGNITFIALGDESLQAMLDVYGYLELQLEVRSATEMRLRPADKAVWNYRTGEREMKKPGGNAWRIAWLAGAVNVVRDRLMESYERIEAEGDNSTALVLMKDVIAEKTRELFPNFGRVPVASKRYNPTAYAAGEVGGRNLDLGGTKLARGQRVLGA
jgi:hypothetical protein